MANKKLNRTSEHRKALLKNMLNSLIKYEQIKTTLPKAKFLKPQADKIITLGKKDTLQTSKMLVSQLQDSKSANKVKKTLSKRYEKRSGGYMTAGSPFIAHEGELVMPSNSGLVANSSVTQAILKACMDRLTGAPSAGEGGGNTIVAPSSVNNTSYVNSGVEIRRELPLVAVG